MSALTDRAALVLMDFQVDLVERGRPGAPDDDEALQRFEGAVQQASRALAHARRQGLDIIHVRVVADDEPFNPHAGLARWLAGSGVLREGTDGARIIAELTPADGEVVLTKRGISSFAGTSLATLLQARGIDTLLLGGIVTHWVVEGTARDAVDRGYRCVVLADACASGSLDRHQGALAILANITTLTTVDEVWSDHH